MIKKTIFIFAILLFFTYSKLVFSLSSSAYLVSDIAFKKHDFETVLNEFDIKSDTINNYNKLISLVILEKILLANDLARIILKENPNHQQALIVHFVYFLKDFKINSIANQLLENEDDLINYIFIKNNRLKSNKEISDTFLEIVEGTIYNQNSYDNLNYNYLLFYLSLTTILDPQNNKAWFLIGQLNLMIEKYDNLEFYYNNIGFDSNYYNDAQYNLAYAYTKSLDFKNAEKKILELYGKNKNNFNLLLLLSNYYRFNGLYEKAIKNYSNLILHKIENKWQVYYFRGICFERINEWDLAEKDFLESLKLHADSPDVLNYLAYSWLERNINIDQSLNMLKKAYEGNPNNYYILDSLAWAHYKKNNLQIAADLMEKVIDMAPNEAISLDHLADIYFSMNRKREAIFLWNQAKSLAEPEDNLIEKINEKLRNFYAG